MSCTDKPISTKMGVSSFNRLRLWVNSIEKILSLVYKYIYIYMCVCVCVCVCVWMYVCMYVLEMIEHFFFRDNYNFLLTSQFESFLSRLPNTLCMEMCQCNYKTFGMIEHLWSHITMAVSLWQGWEDRYHIHHAI